MFRIPFILFGLAAFSGLMFAAIALRRMSGAAPSPRGDDPHADEAGAEFTVSKIERNLRAA